MNGRICIPYTESIRSVYGPYHSTWGVMIIQMRWSFWFNVWNVHWFGENLTFLLIFFFYLGTLKTNRTKKYTKEIGDMGFGGEELLLGGRLFSIIENPIENKFKVYIRESSKKTKIFFLEDYTGLRVDLHNQSSMPRRNTWLIKISPTIF